MWRSSAGRHIDQCSLHLHRHSTAAFSISLELERTNGGRYGAPVRQHHYPTIRLQAGRRPLTIKCCCSCASILDPTLRPLVFPTLHTLNYLQQSRPCITSSIILCPETLGVRFPAAAMADQDASEEAQQPSGFPHSPSAFDADDRVSFSTLDDKFILETEEGTEHEWDTTLRRWIPVVGFVLVPT